MQAIKEVIANNNKIEVIQFEIMKEVVFSSIKKFKNKVVNYKKTAKSCNNVVSN